MSETENHMIVGDADEYESQGLGDCIRRYKRRVDPDSVRDERLERVDGCPLLELGAFTKDQAP